MGHTMNGRHLRHLRMAPAILGALLTLLVVLTAPTVATAAPDLGIDITHRPATPADIGDGSDGTNPHYISRPVRRGDRSYLYNIAFPNSGTAADPIGPGTPLTCPATTWTPTAPAFAPTLSYQWVKNGVSLGSANGAQTDTYTVQAGDAGAEIQCMVKGTNSTNGATASMIF